MKTDYQQFLITLSLLKKKESFGHIRCGHPDNFHTYANISKGAISVLMGLALQVMSGKAYICTPSKIIATHSTQGCMSTGEPLNSHE